jgi:hypothetical protein
MSEYILPTLGSLTVQGPASLNGATAVNNLLSVSGQASLNGGLQTAANTTATFNGSVTLNAGGQVPAGQTLTNAGTLANTGTINNSGTINNTGTISGSGQISAANAYASLSSAYSTTSTSLVSTGLGVQITSPGTVLTVELAAVVANNTAGDGVTLALYRSTSAIPAAGSAPGTSDVAIWNSGSLLSSAANQQQPVSAHIHDAGLSAGTTYYYYLAVQAVTGGTASVNADTAATTLVVRAIQ